MKILGISQEFGRIPDTFIDFVQFGKLEFVGLPVIYNWIFVIMTS